MSESVNLSSISTIHLNSLHKFNEVPHDFKPWECGLSPSALYNCSLSCRKKMGLKTPEVKWMSIKRWVTKTSNGTELPGGTFLSIKRRETFIAIPRPHFEKIEFILIMFPYGNVWSQIDNDIPITEQWLLSYHEGKTIFEWLMMKDAANPVNGYFKSCYEYMKDNMDQLWIHVKRQRKIQQNT